MNAERLLKYYEQIADAPDAFARLRRLILDLAVRGKLVPQDANDEPASELLKRITSERARLVKAGEIANSKNNKPVSLSELAFSIPQNWQPVNIAQALDELQTGPFGSSLHQSDYRIGGIPVINPASIQNEQIVPVDKMAVDERTLQRLASFKLRSGDIVMARRGEMGRCAIVTDREAGWLCGTGSLILRPSRLIYARFLALLIGSPFGREYLGGSAVGSTMQNLNQSILLNLPLGLPPLAEQHRIVAKVEELMALCDRLEAARVSREVARDRLTAASLARLNAPNPQTFHEDARFALDVLPALTTRPDQTKHLRKTILNLAVRGKSCRRTRRMSRRRNC
jgi:type I restriction enzyme S subunit